MRHSRPPEWVCCASCDGNGAGAQCDARYVEPNNRTVCGNIPKSGRRAAPYLCVSTGIGRSRRPRRTGRGAGHLRDRSSRSVTFPKAPAQSEEKPAIDVSVAGCASSRRITSGAIVAA